MVTYEIRIDLSELTDKLSRDELDRVREYLRGHGTLLGLDMVRSPGDEMCVRVRSYHLSEDEVFVRLKEMSYYSNSLESRQFHGSVQIAGSRQETLKRRLKDISSLVTNVSSSTDIEIKLLT